MSIITALVLCSFLFILIEADIPGIPTWAMDLAKCAPGSPKNSRVLGLKDRNRLLQGSGDDSKRKPLHGGDDRRKPLLSDNERRKPLLASDNNKHNERDRLLSRPVSDVLHEQSGRRTKRMGFADDMSNDGIKKWPFIGRFEFAELQNWFPKKHMISNVGTLISPSLVLTARHVIDNIEPEYQKKVTKIYFGSSSRWTVSVSDTSRTVSEIFFYPDPLVDLAVLKLNSPVNCMPVTKTAAIAPLGKGSLDKVYQCKSASWGKDENGQCPTTMKTGSFKLYKQKHEYEICAKGINKTLTNVGDSGMPLMCKEPTTGHWLQYGVFSYDFWAGDYKVSCFVAVPYCYDWIQEKITEFEDEQDVEAFKKRCPAPNSFD